MQASWTSPKTKQSQTITQKAISSTQDEGFLAEEQSDAQSNELSDVLEPKSRVTLREGNISPQQTCEKLSDMISVTPDSSCPASNDSQDEQVFASSGSTSPGSESEQTAPLVSGGEMQLMFRPAVLYHREFSDESPRNYQTYAFEDAEDFQMQNLASAALLMEDEESAQTLLKDSSEVTTETAEFMETTGSQSSGDVANNGPGSSAGPESPQRFCEVVEPSQDSEVYFESGEPGDTEQLYSVHDGDAKTVERLSHRHQEDSTSYVLQLRQMIDQESEVCFHHLDGASNEASAMTTPDDGTHCRDFSSFEFIQSEDVSSQSVSDATPETVTFARHFSFEELVLDPPLAPPPGASEYFGLSVTTKSEMTLSNLEEEYSSLPGGGDTVGSPRSAEESTKVEDRGEGSPGIDCSDPEGYFDCKQAASDLSEPDEPDPCDCLGSVQMPTEKVLLSSESEEYEDAPFAHQTPHAGHADSEERSHSSEPSDDEFTLCEASQPPAACSADDGTDNYLPRVRRASVVEQRRSLRAFPQRASERNDRRPSGWILKFFITLPDSACYFALQKSAWSFTFINISIKRMGVFFSKSLHV